MSVSGRTQSWQEEEHVTLATVSFLFQAWGGYLLWRGLKGQDVFIGHSDLVYITGAIGITVLVSGLLLLWYDAFSMLVNVCVGEDEMEGTILASRMWIVNVYFFQAIASIFVLAAGAIIIGMGWLVRELTKEAVHWLAKPSGKSSAESAG